MRKLGPTKETQIRDYVNSITKRQRAKGQGGRRDYEIFRQRLIKYISGEPITREIFGVRKQSFFQQFKTFGINRAEVLKVRALWQIIDRYKLPSNAAGLEYFIRTTLSLRLDNIDKFVNIFDSINLKPTITEITFLSGFLARHFGWRPPAISETHQHLARRTAERQMIKVRNIILSRLYDPKLLSPGIMARDNGTRSAMNLLAREFGSYEAGLREVGGIQDPAKVFISIARSRARRNKGKRV